MGQRLRRALPAVLAAAYLALACGCDVSEVPRAGNFTITVATADDSRGSAFAGTYQFFRGDKRITRDLSGEGTMSVSFYADKLALVRVHGSSADSIYSLKVSRDGKILYESPVVSANNPILFNPESGGTL